MKYYKLRKKSPIIKYSGSTIQQNHGENLLGHGYTVWNIDTKKYLHVEVPNDYGYYSIDIVDGQLVTDLKDMPAKPKLRVNCKESVATEVKKIVTELRKICDITDLVYVRVDGDTSAKIINNQTIANLAQISNVDYQATLITSYLKDKYPEIDDSTIEDVIGINKTLNESLSKDDQSKNIRWKPKKFEFSNMFSYGEDNVIDFTKLNDVYGVFASNASGKSSLMDALSFCIYDKSGRTFKASQVMNSEKMSFSCKFNFEINGVDYFIERKGLRDKKGNVKVEVDFYSMNGDKKVPHNDEARRSTNAIIRDYMGTYDDFILTTLSLQKNTGSFIDLGQTERKELLSQFIGLTLFEKLAVVASDRIKEIGAAIRAFNKDDSTKKEADMSIEDEVLASKLIDTKRQLEELKDELATTIILTDEEKKKIVKLENVPTSITSLVEERTKLEKQAVLYKGVIENLTQEITVFKEKIQKTKEAIEEFSVHDLDTKYVEGTKNTELLTSKERELDKLKTAVQEKMKKLERLAQHEYDPNCSYCVNNIFVKDAITTKESLAADKLKATELLDSIAKMKAIEEKYIPFLEMLTKRDALVREIPIASNNLSARELKVNQTTSNLEKEAARIQKIDTDIDLYEKSKEIVETNKVVQKNIDELTQKSKNQAIQLKKIEDSYLKDFARKTSLTDQIQLIKTRIEEIELFENESAAFAYYSEAIGTNGIPYQIISEVVPQIEAEVNSILTQIVDFGMSIETDGKNINVYINYEDRKWPLELCSGMEQFIASLALRIALTNVSNLPRSNFMVIDEGMSALDSSNMPMMAAFFSYMKTTFEFVIIISHLDVMRDMVGKQLEITKKDGFSYINI
jgi:DNA repair exonuclease SbcCD ATPase subunit